MKLLYRVFSAFHERGWYNYAHEILKANKEYYGSTNYYYLS